MVATRSAGLVTRTGLGEGQARTTPSQGETPCPHVPRRPASPAPSSSRLTSVTGVFASSHREAPLIGGDPSADNTDLYAFVSPDDPTKPDDHRQLHPAPGAGRRPELLPVRPRRPLPDPHRQQRRRQGRHHATTSGSRPRPSPAISRHLVVPVQRRPDHDASTTRTGSFRRPYKVVRSTKHGGKIARQRPAHRPGQHRAALARPNYATLAAGGVHAVKNGTKVFAGQRDDAFFVDLGSIFDLAGLRPFNNLHVIPLAAAAGVDGVAGFNTTSIAIQVPLDRGPQERRRNDPAVSACGPAPAGRSTRRINSNGTRHVVRQVGQVSRLGNPLINEVIIPRHHEGLLERPGAVQGQAVRQVLRGAGAHRGRQLPVPRARRREHDRSHRPRRCPAHRVKSPGVNVRSAPVHRRHSADMLRVNTAVKPTPPVPAPSASRRMAAAGPPGRHRRRPVRLPERPSSARRRHRHRAPRPRRGLRPDPQRGPRRAEPHPEQPARRRRRRQRHAVPVDLPVRSGRRTRLRARPDHPVPGRSRCLDPRRPTVDDLATSDERVPGRAPGPLVRFPRAAPRLRDRASPGRHDAP